VVGPVGSGKSTVSRLMEQTGYSYLNSGRALAQLMQIPPVPITGRAEFQEAANAFISADGGTDRLGEHMADEIRRSGNDRWVIDGVRQGGTLLALERSLADFDTATVFVVTPMAVASRFHRRDTQRLSPPETLEVVRSAAVEREVEGMRLTASAVVYNAGHDLTLTVQSLLVALVDVHAFSWVTQYVGLAVPSASRRSIRPHGDHPRNQSRKRKGK
jgi:cytidylate kinase